jgi:hypothetical protein
MFLKIDNSSKYCNHFNSTIKALMEDYGDFIFIFKEHMVIIRGTGNHNYLLNVVKIKKEDSDNCFLVDILIENYKFECFTNISFQIFKHLRRFYPEFKDVDFPVNMAKFKAVDNAEDIIYTKE